jgi:PKD domain
MPGPDGPVGGSTGGPAPFQPECGTAGVNLVLDPATCTPDQRAVEPLYRRVPDPTAPGGWSPWTLVDQGGCVVDVDIRAAIARELQRLPLTPSTLSVQPPSGWTLVNADTVAFADDQEQTLTTTVLGFPVAIRATPMSFTWDFGDRSAPITTKDPGRPWPEHTIAHRYTAEGTHRISLTTTWSAVFQIAGTAGWEPVAGTATTTSTSAPLEVHEARSRLVAEGTT